MEARKRKEAEEAEKRRKEEEKKAKELEKERAKDLEKQKKKEEKEAKKGGVRDSALFADDVDAADDDVDPSWDALMSPRSGAPGSPSAGPGGSPSSPVLARSGTGTMSRGPTATIVVDSSGVKTLKRQQSAGGDAGGSPDGYGTMRMGTMTLRRKHGKPLTTLPAAPPILQKGDEHKHSFQEFAARNFQSGGGKTGMGMGTLQRTADKRKTVSVNY